ncbi:glucose-1-phosphate adenylyltransferase [Saonia flava]|uniref:Glucose-1-phosphate adenylyltransferase n=1 Tax=Saonia flava TaxID=523696 RepID=A0A846QWY5_9FLAO|nr:sugar phosphate nucleotidyltransferase [Saonia flava]NJB71102.1 glucose-1-phosphate adenylyltransferase [Saonia flava]
MHNNLIILAGGASSRMKKEANNPNLSQKDIEQANNKSKGLIGVGEEGLPFLHYLLNNAKKAGYTNIFIIIGENDTHFQEVYGSGIKGNEFHGLSISFARQYIPIGRAKPFGTADAVFQTLEQFPELQSQTFTVCNSDNLYSVEALSLLKNTTSTNALLGYDRDTLEYPEERIARFALIKMDDANYMVDIIEKPTIEEVPKYKDKNGKLRVSMNIFKFSGTMFYPYLKNCPVHPERNEKELPTALLNMIQDHAQSTKIIPIAEHVIDLTSKQDIENVREYLKENYPKLIW